MPIPQQSFTGGEKSQINNAKMSESFFINPALKDMATENFHAIKPINLRYSKPITTLQRSVGTTPTMTAM